MCNCFDVDASQNDSIGHIKLSVNNETKHIDIEDNLVKASYRRNGIATKLYKEAFNELNNNIEKYPAFTIGGHPTLDAKKLLTSFIGTKHKKGYYTDELDNCLQRNKVSGVKAMLNIDNYNFQDRQINVAACFNGQPSVEESRRDSSPLGRLNKRPLNIHSDKINLDKTPKPSTFKKT